MMKKSLNYISLFFIICLSTYFIKSIRKTDVVLVGYIDKSDGIGQTIPNINKLFKNKKIKTKYVNFLETYYNDLPTNFVIHCHYRGWGNNLKKNNTISMAYTNFENTKVYKTWVNALNANFDAVIVTDQSISEIFVDSGVTVPVFVLPLPFDVKKFAAHQKERTKSEKPFYFGCTAAFWERKNHQLLLEAFYKEFGTDPNIRLKLNGRFGDMFETLQNLIHWNKLTNVELTQKKIDDEEYIDYMNSLDCFVLLSKGEGYSIPPREAMALKIPCILSNNTAHKVICDSGFVRAVKSDILKPAKNEFESNRDTENVGYNFDCELKDVRQALRDVYENYSQYTELAKKGFDWVKQYDSENLQNLFANLIKPKKIILGSENKITAEFLMTNSKELFDKYNNLNKQ